ncbi:MAG TPA: hypothetical protein PKI32_10075, partial [Opitutales bacterium]|nr:hypothetical protein [Opitutales bacterium]
MRHSRIALITAALSASALPALASEPLESYLSAGTAAYVSVADCKSTAFNTCGPINDLRNNAQLQDYFKPISKAIDTMLDESDDDPLMKWPEFTAHLSGQAVVGLDLTTLLASVASGSEDINPPVLEFIAATKDGDDLVGTLVARLKDAERMKGENMTFVGSETFMKTEIFEFFVRNAGQDGASGGAQQYDANGDPITPVPSDEPTGVSESSSSAAETAAEPGQSKNDVHFFFGTCQDLLFVTTSQENARSIIEAIKGREEGTLAVDSQAASVRRSGEKCDGYVYIDLRPVGTMVNNLIRSKLETPAGAQPDPSKPDADAVINALGMDSLHYLFMGVRFDNDEAVLLTTFAIDTDKGIGRIFSSCADSFPTPDFIPEKVSSVSSSSFSLGKAVAELRQIVFNAYPMASMMYTAQMSNIQAQTGVNVDVDLIDNL